MPNNHVYQWRRHLTLRTIRRLRREGFGVLLFKYRNNLALYRQQRGMTDWEWVNYLRELNQTKRST